MNEHIQPEVLSISEFCVRNRMSTATYYKMVREGRGPRVMDYGSTMRISMQAELDWRREREEAAVSAAGKLEHERRKAQAVRAGKAAIASPLHHRGKAKGKKLVRT
jgi:hypothetical protein